MSISCYGKGCDLIATVKISCLLSCDFVIKIYNMIGCNGKLRYNKNGKGLLDFIVH
jgi:hypothetical protein